MLEIYLRRIRDSFGGTRTMLLISPPTASADSYFRFKQTKAIDGRGIL